MVKVNNKDTRTTTTLKMFCKIVEVKKKQLKQLTPFAKKLHHRRCFGVFTVNFEYILHLVLVFLVVNFKHVTAGWGSGVVFSKVAGLQDYGDVNNHVSSLSELHQNMINLIIIFSYKCFHFSPDAN